MRPSLRERLLDRLGPILATLGIMYVVAMAFALGQFVGEREGARRANEVCYCARN